MNIFVYSDESGVFDVAHNDFYVFGGILFLSKNEKDNEYSFNVVGCPYGRMPAG